MRKYKVNTHTGNGEPRWFIIFAESMRDAVDLLAFCPGQVKAVRSSDGSSSILTYGETFISCYYNDNRQGQKHPVNIIFGGLA